MTKPCLQLERKERGSRVINTGIPNPVVRPAMGPQGNRLVVKLRLEHAVRGRQSPLVHIQKRKTTAKVKNGLLRTLENGLHIVLFIY